MCIRDRGVPPDGAAGAGRAGRFGTSVGSSTAGSGGAVAVGGADAKSAARSADGADSPRSRGPSSSPDRSQPAWRARSAAISAHSPIPRSAKDPRFDPPRPASVPTTGQSSQRPEHRRRGLASCATGISSCSTEPQCRAGPCSESCPRCASHRDTPPYEAPRPPCDRGSWSSREQP